jgi:hypothetical protein
MKVQEAKGACKDCSKWKEVSLPTPMGNGRDVMYVYPIITLYTSCSFFSFIMC